MRGDHFNSGLRTSVVLSVILHAGVAFVASTMPVQADSARTHPRAGSLDGSLVSFDLSDPSTTPPTETPEAAPLATMLPLPDLAPPQMTPEELARKLVLGIDESTQKTENWMGSADPTEHKAPLSSVDQPQLDPNPGMPGAPTDMGVSQNGPQAPVVPNTAPAESVVQPSPMEVRPARDGVKAPESKLPGAATPREGGADGIDQPGTPTPRPGEDHATGERVSKPARGTPEIPHLDPNLPGPPPEDRGHHGEALHARPDEITVEGPTKIEPTKAAAPVTEIIAHPEAALPPAPGLPNTNVPAAPTAPMPAGGPNVSAAPGSTGERPGDKSPKEADAASKTPTVEIRPGKPAAAQGLDITTKRPTFTRFVRATAYPQQNPLYKVTFNRFGLVSKVVLMESSGVPDIDGPVLNAIYQWTAKGKVLAELSAADPTGGITVSVRILLR
jgi:hypothetical protein